MSRSSSALAAYDDERVQKALADVREVTEQMKHLEDVLLGTFGPEARPRSKPTLKRHISHTAHSVVSAASNVAAHHAPRLQHKKTRDLLSRRDLEGLHKTNNTLSFLQEVEAKRLQSRGDEIHVQPVWAIVFKMPKKVTEEADLNDLDIGNADPNESQGHNVIRISHEAWLIAEGLIACDFKVTHRVSFDGTRLILLVAVPYDVLVNEAQSGQMKMRLSETKGTLPFHADLQQFYAANHGGLNEFKHGKWTRRDPALANTGITPISHVSASDREMITEQEMQEPTIDDKHHGQSIFTSALAQRLAMHRMKRVGLINLEQIMTVKHPDVVRRNIQQMVTARKTIHANKITTLLIAHGGFRAEHKKVFPPRDGKLVVSKLVLAVQKDPEFIISQHMDADKCISEKCISHTLPDSQLPSYDLISKACSVLEEWRNPVTGRGREEQFCGTMQMWLPVHNPEELEYLTHQWGTFTLVFKPVLVGYNPEQAPTVFDRGPPQQVEHNTFGSYLNIPHEHALPWSWAYQPLEEVRDYFGDEVALYFSWLGAYTKALGMSAVFGIATMILQPIYGGVDKNPGTLAYSVYVGVWSISFLSAWARRENELNFLWGTEGLSLKEEPRLQFVGEIIYNSDTGRTYKVPISQSVQIGKRALSIVVVVIMIIMTILAATGAMLLRYLGDDEEADFGSGSGSSADVEELGFVDSIRKMIYDQRFTFLSSATGLTVIGIFDVLTSSVFLKLNEFENHRSQSDFANALVAKNFCFQFVNNYFILFYIAYMREIPDPFSNTAHPCKKGSCLDELQLQLVVVFTAKTIGKQVFNLLKPFLFMLFNKVKQNRQISSLIKNVTAASAGIVQQSGIARFVPSVENLLLDQDKEAQKVTDVYELQTQKMPYPGTFDDFNDRAIQFGYLVLFAPAYPLAPALALLNNVIEIRSAAYRMCHGFQRPVYTEREGIGSWFVVLNVLGFMAVITNASMIAFVGSQEAERFSLIPENNVGIKQCRLGVISVEENCVAEGAVRFSQRIDYYELWMVFIVTEHGMMLLRVAILTAAPIMPAWIHSARETLEYRILHIYKTGAQLEMEQRAREQFLHKLHDKRQMIMDKLCMTKDQMKQKFDEVDSDHSGTIDKREVASFFAFLEIGLTDAEVQIVIETMDDQDDDGSISFDELITWLTREQMWDPELAEKKRKAHVWHTENMILKTTGIIQRNAARAMMQRTRKIHNSRPTANEPEAEHSDAEEFSNPLAVRK